MKIAQNMCNSFSVRTFREKRRLGAPYDDRLAVGRRASQQALTGTDCHPTRIFPTAVHRMTSCTGHTDEHASQ